MFVVLKNVRRVNSNAFAARVLATALFQYKYHTFFQELQQRLLHPFNRHVASDTLMLSLLCNFVDLVNVHDTTLISSVL